MMASLKLIDLATVIRASSRRLFTGRSFHETMKPSIPAAFAWAICRRITASSSLE